MDQLFLSFESLIGLPSVFGYLGSLVFGTLVGSFLNVVIHRVPNEESIVFPNSKCPKCDSAIKPYDNIPILSWLILGGKCRSCKAPISIRYPGVELLNGLLWVAMYWAVGFTPALPVAFVFASVVLALIFIDAEHMILPNVITYPFFVFVLVARVGFAIFVGGTPYFSDLTHWPASLLSDSPEILTTLFSGALGSLAGGGSLWLIGELWKRLRGVEAMGLGDVKMMLGVGMLLGWQLSFLSIFLASFAGAVAGAVYVALRKDKDMQSQIPFGIFLGIGSLLAFICGGNLIEWYIRTFVP